MQLTTEHPASSDGIPVLVTDDGTPLVPADWLPGHACTVWRWVLDHRGAFDDELAERFLDVTPDQFSDLLLLDLKKRP